MTEYISEFELWIYLSEEYRGSREVKLSECCKIMRAGDTEFPAPYPDVLFLYLVTANGKVKLKDHVFGDAQILRTEFAHSLKELQDQGHSILRNAEMDSSGVYLIFDRSPGGSALITYSLIEQDNSDVGEFYLTFPIPDVHGEPEDIYRLFSKTINGRYKCQQEQWLVSEDILKREFEKCIREIDELLALLNK